MPITCPSCQANYKISDEALGDGRQVRCARCRTVWFAEPDPVNADWSEPDETPGSGATFATEDVGAPIVGLADSNEIVEIDPAAPVDVAPDRRRRRLPFPFMWKRPRRSKPGPPTRLRATTVVAAIGIVALGALVSGRVEAVRFAPSLASLYAAVGLPVNVRGLEIREVRSMEEVVDGGPLLVVTGVVENVSHDELDVPRLRLAVTAGSGREVYAWTTMATRSKLAPGETAAFRARLASPPAEGQMVEARFLGRRDLAATAAR